MSNFLTLTKVFFLSGFNVNLKKKNQRSAFSLFGLTLLLFALGSFGISMSFITKIEDFGLEKEAFLSLMLLVAFMLNFVLSIHQVQSIIFNTKDYEFLESLPVKKATIVAAKLCSFYLINVAEDIALILPAIIMYLLMAQGTIVPAVLAFACALVISVIPILLSAIIGSLSALISSKSKHSNLINIISSALFLVAFFAGYMYLIYGDASGITGFMDNVFFLSWLHTGISGKAIDVLYYYLFSLAVLVAVIIFISLIYQPVNAWLHSKNDHVDYEKVKKDASKQNLGLNHMLLKKEWYMVSKRPQYLLNSIIGPFFFLVMGIIALFFPAMLAGGEEGQDPSSREFMGLIMAFMLPPLGILMNSITSTSACSISFETRYGYEMLRSYPVDANRFIKAKVFMALIISCTMNLVISLILVGLAIFRGLYQPYYLIPIVLYPQLACVLTAIVGMLTGLRWPKLDFENEAQVIKNSAAANFLVLFIMLPSMLLFGVSYAADIVAIEMQMEFIHYIGMCLVILTYVIVIPIMLAVLKKKGLALFDRIISIK